MVSFSHKFSKGSIPHLTYWGFRRVIQKWTTLHARFLAWWWGISLENACIFTGLPKFQRHPQSTIKIGSDCNFLSTPTSNLLGLNHPCIIATIKPLASLTIGKKCGFSGISIGCAKKITIGDNFRAGANTIITDSDWHFDDWRTGPDLPIEIGTNVWLGANTIVLKGVSIGDNSIVGAGSVITKSLPSDVMAGGNPARVIKHIDKRT